ENNVIVAQLSGSDPRRLSSALGPRPQASAPIQLDGYDIVAEMSRGGQGVVYRAYQKATKRPVALKILLQGAFATTRQRYRFEREIELAAGLRHPNIVTIYESGATADGRHYCAMEFIEGLPLDQYLAKSNGRKTRLGLERCLRLFVKICDAVSY